MGSSPTSGYVFFLTNSHVLLHCLFLLRVSGRPVIAHGPWMVSKDQRLGALGGLVGLGQSRCGASRSTHFVPWLPAFRASRCRARHGAWNPAACRLQHTSAPTARTVSQYRSRARDRDDFITSSHALRFPAPLLIGPLASCIFFRPQQTRATLAPASPHRPASCSPQDTQHDVDPTTSHGPGHDPRHKEDSQAQGLWYAARRLRRAARPHSPTLLLGGPGLTAMAPHRLRRLGRLDRVHDQPRQQAQKDGEICEKRPPDIIEWSRRVQGGSLTPGPAPLGETPRADPPR